MSNRFLVGHFFLGFLIRIFGGAYPIVTDKHHHLCLTYFNKFHVTYNHHHLSLTDVYVQHISTNCISPINSIIYTWNSCLCLTHFIKFYVTYKHHLTYKYHILYLTQCFYVWHISTFCMSPINTIIYLWHSCLCLTHFNKLHVTDKHHHLHMT